MNGYLFNLSEQNFKLIAEQFYDNPQCFSFCEFDQDLKRFGTVSRMFDKGHIDDKERCRNLLNNIIIINNTFGSFTPYGLFYKIDEKHWAQLKTFLSFLKIMPTNCQQYQLPDDQSILNILNGL